MGGSFQLPFAFSFREELNFASFRPTAANAALLHYLQAFEAGSDQFCFVWGAAGTGKTHLLQALSHASSAAVYLPLAQLRLHGPGSLEGLGDFAFLVLDDLQAIAGDSAWEEQLFQLFNALHAQGGRICMAADRNPGALPLQLADLRSRLQLSVVFEVQPLDETGRCDVLVQRAQQRGIELRDDVAAYIMARSPRGLADLLAVLDRLDMLSLAEKRRVTIPFIRGIFGW
jgi:DnaA-homolog protein